MVRNLVIVLTILIVCAATVAGGTYWMKHYSLRGKIFEVSVKVRSENGPVEITLPLKFHARQVSFDAVRKGVMEELQDRGVRVSRERIEILTMQQL
jgi:hypothetical protein